MSTIRRILLGATMSSAAIVTVVACSDDPEAPRPSFDSQDAASDVPPPDLPKPGDDASTRPDAPDARPPFDPADEPVACPDAGPCAKEIVAGQNHFCARLSDGTVRCWGDDEYGALGGGEPEPPPKGGDPDAGAGADAGDAGAKSATVAVAKLTGATQLSAARATTCARLEDGGIACWGSNSFGQLGLTAGKPSWDEWRHETAAPVALAEPAKRVDVGPEDVCAVLANGKVWCWGTNRLAQLARPDNTDLDYVMAPGEASLAPFAVAKTAIGSGTLFGLTATGEVVSWGSVAGSEGFLGGRMTSISPDPMPNAIPQLVGVTSMVATATLMEGEGGPLGVPSIGPFPPPPIARHAHACAIVKGQVYCWGKSDTSALCTGLPDNELWPTPAPTSGPAWPQQLAVGDEITCARMTDGTLQCCGANAYGRLGAGMTEPLTPLFRPVTSLTGHAVQVATSNRAVCVLLKNGTVECWGGNAHGELALGKTDEDPHPSPVKVTF
jgi:alpha-tubulin suppressor-like RCC1 family protein